MQGDTNSSTNGIQDASGGNGLLVRYNYSLVQNEYSILINKMPSWLEVSPLSGTVVPEEVSEVSLDIFSQGLVAGEYNYDLQIETNDYENSLITIPIYLSIIEDACAGWELGDVNQDSQLNILDVTGLVNIALGLVEPEECQLEISDLNLDSSVNILDILALVNLILGTN